LKESTIEAAQLGIELIENLQQLVVSGEMVDTTEGVQKLMLHKLKKVILILFTLVI